MSPFTAVITLLTAVSAILSSPVYCESCDVSNTNPDLPANQTEITVPAGQTTKMIALGVGLQNYTCTDEGTYNLIGSIATLFDTSCIVQKDGGSSLTTNAFDVWNTAEGADVSKVEEIFPEYAVWADHYWQTRGSGRNPVFDARARSMKGDPNAYIVAKVTGHLKAPTGEQDVDWYYLENIEGCLAKSMLRVDTRGGKAPASCEPGSSIRVKYTCNYYFYN